MPKRQAELDIISAIKDKTLIGDDISPQKEALLRALYGLPLQKDKFKTLMFKESKGFFWKEETANDFLYRATCTDRYRPREYTEATFLLGARGGKSDKLASNIAIYEGCLKTWKLSRGEKGYMITVAVDIPQANIVHGFISGKIQASPILSQLLDQHEDDTRYTPIKKDTVELRNGIVMKVMPCNFASIRGYTAIGAVGDEFAAWRDEKGSSNPATEVIRTIKGRMATQPGAKLVKITSPLVKFGIAWKEWRAQLQGKNKYILVAKAPAWEVNPMIDQKFLLQIYETDPLMFLRDYGAEFVDSISGLLPPEKVDACVMPEKRELKPESGKTYFAALDASGLEHDDFAFAVGHRDGNTVVIDQILVWEANKHDPPKQDDVIAACARAARNYFTSEITGDQFCAKPIQQQLAKLGVMFNEIPFSQNSKQQIYTTLRSLVMTGNLQIPDDPKAAQQLKTLEATLGALGHVRIKATRGAHDDVATVIALVCFLVTQTSGNAEAWIDALSGGLNKPEVDPGSGMTRCVDCGKMIPFGEEYFGVGAGTGQCMTCHAAHGNPNYAATRLPEGEPRLLDVR